MTEIAPVLLAITLYNSRKFLGKLFYYIHKLNPVPKLTLFIENNSTDGTVEYTYRNYKLPFKMCRMWFTPEAPKKLEPEGYGIIALIRQIALDYFRSHKEYEYLMFLDDDCYPITEDYIAKLTEWKFDLIGAPYCVDEQTEVLTLEGWKKINDLTLDDEILVYENEKLKYDKMEAIHKFYYKGEMIHIKTNHLDMLLTPNHKVYCKYYKEKWHKNSYTTTKWYMRNAEKLTKYYLIKVSGKNKYGKQKINRKLAELCGWILTDGHYKKECDAIELYQTLEPHPEKVQRIEYLLNSLNVKYKKYIRQRPERRYRTDITFYITDKEIIRQIKNIFKDKKPNYRILKEWNKESLKSLLKGIILGDGYKDRTNIRIAGKKEYLDFYNALAIRLGFSGVVRKKDCSINKRRIRSLQRARITREYYEGIVWCPQVKSGLWLARRNGRTFITGNSRVYPEGIFCAAKWGTTHPYRFMLKKEHELKYPLDTPMMISGGTMCISRRLAEDKRINFYPVRVPEVPITIKTQSSEDYGYCLKARHYGYLCYWDTRVKVYHDYIKTAQDPKAWAVRQDKTGYIDFKYSE